MEEEAFGLLEFGLVVSGDVLEFPDMLLSGEVEVPVVLCEPVELPTELELPLPTVVLLETFVVFTWFTTVLLPATCWANCSTFCLSASFGTEPVTTAWLF